MSNDVQRLKTILREAAAGEILPRWREATASPKGDGSLVTAADLAAQHRIAEALAQDFPGIPLLGEEMSAEDQMGLLSTSGSAIWVLDPIDGTSNYANGFPHFAVSLALLQDGAVELGLVLDPVRDECFHAIRGQGAFSDESPIRPTRGHARLSDCLASIDLKRLSPETLARLFAQPAFRSQRNLGSVALDWCWLAAGRFQLYLHGGQRLWDYAAGRLIAQEAGAASVLLDTLGGRAEHSADLEPRVAIGAASGSLLKQWSIVTGFSS